MSAYPRHQAMHCIRAGSITHQPPQHNQCGRDRDHRHAHRHPRMRRTIGGAVLHGHVKRSRNHGRNRCGYITSAATGMFRRGREVRRRTDGNSARTMAARWMRHRHRMHQQHTREDRQRSAHHQYRGQPLPTEPSRTNAVQRNTAAETHNHDHGASLHPQQSASIPRGGMAPQCSQSQFRGSWLDSSLLTHPVFGNPPASAQLRRAWV